MPPKPVYKCRLVPRALFRVQRAATVGVRPSSVPIQICLPREQSFFFVQRRNKHFKLIAGRVGPGVIQKQNSTFLLVAVQVRNWRKKRVVLTQVFKNVWAAAEKSTLKRSLDQPRKVTGMVLLHPGDALFVILLKQNALSSVIYILCFRFFCFFFAR